MDHEARCAFVHAQAVCAMAEIAGMQAENAIAQSEGAELPYRKTHFDALQYNYTISHNSVIEYLRS
jgi:hypothetical protein